MRRNNQVALVFAVFVIDQNEHPPGAGLRDQIFGGSEGDAEVLSGQAQAGHRVVEVAAEEEGGHAHVAAGRAGLDDFEQGVGVQPGLGGQDKALLHGDGGGQEDLVVDQLGDRALAAVADVEDARREGFEDGREGRDRRAVSLVRDPRWTSPTPWFLPGTKGDGGEGGGGHGPRVFVWACALRPGGRGKHHRAVFAFC